MYKTISGSAKDNVNAFTEGKLSLLEEIHAGFHGHGENKMKIAVLSGKGGTGKTLYR